ncbi:MAG TPA: VOC family protein [Ilumatobacteraceae bacterium]|nr:VOC family protein [Ilumatobacteraceae bacterium]HRB02278.1 VOC family protein [Ilumatobacteraceae bacterium]
MSSAFDLVTIDSPHPDVLASFWCAALSLHESQREDGDRWFVLSDANGVRRLGIQRNMHGSGGTHLDLACSRSEFMDEVTRLVALGASLVKPPRMEPYGSIANLADTDGNPFDLCAYGP